LEQSVKRLGGNAPKVKLKIKGLPLKKKSLSKRYAEILKLRAAIRQSRQAKTAAKQPTYQ
jgi:hypothetical protein